MCGVKNDWRLAYSYEWMKTYNEISMDISYKGNIQRKSLQTVNQQILCSKTNLLNYLIVYVRRISD